MRTTLFVLLLFAGLAGCSERPPFPVTGRLSDQQLDWYASRACHALWSRRELVVN